MPPASPHPREAARAAMNDAAAYAEAMHRSWFESSMQGYTGAPLPPAPHLPPEAAREARRRLQAALDQQRDAEPVASLRASFEWHRRGLDGRQSAMLSRLVDDWIGCDAGWPEASLAALLADQAGILGEDDVARALEAMHDSQLLDFEVVATAPEASPHPGDLPLLRISTNERVWVTAAPLTGRPPEGTWLQARLWPAGEGRWTLAPGLLVRSESPPDLRPQPDSPDLDPVNVQERLADLLQDWCAELRHARRLARLLPPA